MKVEEKKNTKIIMEQKGNVMVERGREKEQRIRRMGKTEKEGYETTNNSK